MDVAVAVERVVDSAFKNMLSNTQFRNLNLREQYAFRQMILHTILASQVIAQGVVRGESVEAESPKVMEKLRGIRSILDEMSKRGMSLIRDGRSPEGAMPVTEEDVAKLAEHFLARGVQSNLAAVKVESSESGGVDSAVDRLKKLQGGGA
jgi:hypothetical protein